MTKYLFFVFLAIIGFAYRPWFYLSKSLSSGDWPYLYFQNIQAFKIPTEFPFLWLEPYYQITAKIGAQVFSLSWEMTEKFFWFYPFLILSILSSFIFLRYIAKYLVIEKYWLFVFFGCLIFTTNTYILMVVGGGQMGVAMAYSMMPLVLFNFLNLINSNFSPRFDFKFKISNLKFLGISLISAVQLMLDPRIFLLSVFIIFLYVLFTFREIKLKDIKKLILIFILTLILNSFWILPNLNHLNIVYNFSVADADAKFLSFATFPNSISLLHPNWPENIFGKIGFMKSEFVILAILAYIPLFFKSNRKILFFSFLGIFGAFFAKGTNPPFGEIYIWLSNIPGFSIFRDPTKFYTMIVVSYMVLLPYSLIKLSEKVSSIKYYVLGIFAFIFLAYWLFLIRPAIFGQLTGTFDPRVVPEEYFSLKNFLIAQPESTKTLWVPRVQRFGFNSKSMPAVSSIDVIGTGSSSGVLDEFDTKEVKKQLIDEKVKYVIVPYDVLSEIFLTDRKYDDKLYKEAVERMKNTSWLLELKNHEFGKIKVFKVSY